MRSFLISPALIGSVAPARMSKPLSTCVRHASRKASSRRSICAQTSASVAGGVFAELRVQVDQQHPLVLVRGQRVADVAGDEAGTGAALARHEGDHARFFPGPGGEVGLQPLEGIGQLAALQRPGQHIAHAGAQRADQQVGLLRLRDEDAGQVGVLLAQRFNALHLRGAAVGLVDDQHIGAAQLAGMRGQVGRRVLQPHDLVASAGG
jgi:hypothetical protein